MLEVRIIDAAILALVSPNCRRHPKPGSLVARGCVFFSQANKNLYWSTHTTYDTTTTTNTNANTFLQSQCANKSVQLITITNNTIKNILYITFIPKAIESYKRNDSLKRIVTGYTRKIVPHFLLN